MSEGAGDHDADADKNKGKGDKDEDGDTEEDKSWNPFASGAKTSTLHLATVLFTVYYPSDISDKDEKYHSHVTWIGRPKHKGLAALFSYLGQYGIFSIPASPALLLLLSARMPALVAAPLADPKHPQARAPPPADRVEAGNLGAVPPKFPLVIFSHGLAGNRLTYSQYCGELASQGVIVAAVEHRDGSGIASMVRPPSWKDEADIEENSAERRRKQKQPKATVPYFQFERIGLRSFAEEPNEKEIALRKAQMAMRAAELEECLYVLTRIAKGEGEEVAKNSTRGLGSKLGKRHRRAAQRKEDVRYSLEEEPKRLASWKGRLDTDFPCLVGHSFGGATVIEMQRKGPIRTSEGQEESKRSMFPFTIILDPGWSPSRLTTTGR
ncbi:hypothetical protein L7F22_011850 [Adiantum nelumboides]|nr:hypothetical protein [Adiantum nelumboides]